MPETGVGLFFDCRFDIDNLTCTDLTLTRCRAELKMRNTVGIATCDNMTLTNLVVTNHENRIFLGNAGSTDGGRFTNCTIINPKIGSGNGTIFVSDELSPSGNSIDIYRGNFNAQLNNQLGDPGVRIFNGFP
jgi:hypothetical protein